MKKKKHNPNVLLHLITLFIFALVAECLAVLFVGNTVLFLIFAGVTVALCLSAYLAIRRTGNVVSGFYKSVIERLALPNSDLYNQFELPVAILLDNSVLWYNSQFRLHVLNNNDVVGGLPEDVLHQSALTNLELTGKAEMQFNNKHYRIYGSRLEEQDKQLLVLYYVDITHLKQIEHEYKETRFVAAVLSVDSFDEITDDMPESVAASFKGAIDREIEKFTAEISGITKKLRNNRYISVFDERSLSRLKACKFQVLDNVRNLDFGGKTHATLSVGVGRGAKTLKECEVLALQALEMSQGRGGDQATIKTNDTYEFFGGITNSAVEKRTKVKTRTVASALKELIRGSESVFLMGHKYGDIDSLGACYGLWQCAAALEKECYIVVNENSHLAGSLIQKIKAENKHTVIITPEQALSRINRKSLLVVCDTHRRDFLESPELYDACRTTVVIDHHRKSTDYIRNTVIFYHEPYASSTCEMVSELVQYMNIGTVEKSRAEALLAGIMLDTRNFVLRTGVRTFEASAYLRSCGADPVAVKKLFSDSITVYRERAMLVSKAEFFGPNAVTSAGAGVSVSRVAASQAADELLNIENVDASFVLYEAGENVNISARSLGKVNVQLIMEALGGGGHHTMAAVQIKECTLEEAKSRLLQLIEPSTGKDD